MNRRSGNRLGMKFKVRIKGADARGLAFEECVETLNVSAQGIALLTRRELAHSSSLTVTIPRRGMSRPRGGRADFVAHATVAYVLPEGDLNRIGLRFIATTLQLSQNSGHY